MLSGRKVESVQKSVADNRISQRFCDDLYSSKVPRTNDYKMKTFNHGDLGEANLNVKQLKLNKN